MFRFSAQQWLVLCLALVGSAIAHAAPPVFPPADTAALQAVVAGDWRSPEHRARDVYRHPLDTLQFFGMRPDMTVIELTPGGGWYTEILAPYLRNHGHLIEATGPSRSFDAKLAANPAVYGKIAGAVPFAPPHQLALGPAQSADMVVSFRNTHDWLNQSPATLAGVFSAVFKVLKPGGVFGLTEHRAKPSATATESARLLHRIPEAYLIQAARDAGFKLADSSEVNANPEDPREVNVHRLLPDLAGPESEHAAMRAIGESDRMTLKFVKP